MSNYINKAKARRKPFTRSQYKVTENLLVRGTISADNPISRKESKAITGHQKALYKRW